VTVEHAPRRLRHICLSLAVLLVVVFGVLAVLLPQGSTDGQTFGLADQISFFGIGLLLAAAMLGFTRFRVRADERGIYVRNVLGERFFDWRLVVGIDIPDGATWAQLELHDDETVALLALQTSDGDAAVDAVLALRRLLRAAQEAPHEGEVSGP
jgi:hypothetical protein